MTQLALAVDADDELWTLDALPTPEAPYVTVGDELIEVRARFPSQIYSLTGQALPPKIRVRRGIAGTTKASHIQGSTLTPNYGLGGGAGAGGVPDPTGAPDGQVPTTADGAYGLSSTFGPEGIGPEDGTATVTTTAPPDDGAAEIAVQAHAGADQAGSVIVSASSDGGAALVENNATTDSGTATARLHAEATGSGDSEAQVAVIADDLIGGFTVLAGVVARHVDGVGDMLDITDGNGLLGSEADPGAVLTQDATVGSKWVVLDPLTSTGTIVISAGVGPTIQVTIASDGAFEISGTGVVRMPFLPTADPVVAGQLWNDAGTLKVSAG